MYKFLPALACSLMFAVGAAPIEAARAEPPQPTEYFEPEASFIVCDTREQILQVVDALKTHKLQETLAAFSSHLDEKHEPACLFSSLGPVVFGSSEHVGLAFDHNVGFDIWVSHVANENTEFFLLWAETGKGSSV